MPQKNHKIKKIFRELRKLSNRERGLIAIMAWWLIIGHIYKRCLPFRIIAKTLGKHGINPQIDLSPQKKLKLDKLRNLFGKVAYTLPMHTTCLVRAFAMAQILKKRRIPYTVFIGVSFDPQKTIKAHAWVRCGAITVIGGDGEMNFTVISTFGNTF